MFNPDRSSINKLKVGAHIYFNDNKNDGYPYPLIEEFAFHEKDDLLVHGEIRTSEENTSPEKIFSGKEISSAQKFIKKAKSGVVAEKGINFLGLNTIEKEIKFELEGLGYKEKWIVDCIADKFIKDNDCFFLRNDNSELVLDSNDIAYFQNNPDFLKNEPSFTIDLTDREIKNILGLDKKLKGWEIKELVLNLAKKAYINGRVKYIYEKDTYQEIEIIGHFCDVYYKEIGILSNRKNIPEEHKVERRYYFRLNTPWAMAFLSNLLNGKFTIFNKSFYGLKPKGQELMRYMSNWGEKKTFLTIHQFGEILGYKEDIKNITERKLFLKKILNELKIKGFIKNWNFGGRGRKTYYKIEKNSNKKLPVI